MADDTIDFRSDKPALDKRDKLLCDLLGTASKITFDRDTFGGKEPRKVAFLTMFASYLKKDLKYENPADTPRKEKRRDIFSTLDDLFNTDVLPAAVIRQHVQESMPSDSIRNNSREVIRDISFFLGTVAYTRLSAEELTSLISLRNSRSSSIENRSYLQKAIYRHVTAGGVLADSTAIAKLTDFIAIGAVDPFVTLYYSGLYDFGGYDSFSSVIYHIFALDPQNREEAHVIIRNIKEANEVRTDALVRDGILSRNKIPMSTRPSSTYTVIELVQHRKKDLGNYATSEEIFGVISETYQKLPKKDPESLTLIQQYLSKYLSILKYRTGTPELFLKNIVPKLIKEDPQHFQTLVAILLESLDNNIAVSKSSYGRITLIEQEQYLRVLTSLSAEQLLIYNANIELVRAANKGLYHSRNMIKEECVVKSLLLELSTKPFKESAEQEEIRKMIISTFKKDYAAVLLKESYAGRFSTLSAVQAAAVFQCYTGIDMIQLFKEAKEKDIRTFYHNIQKQLHIASAADAEKLRQFNESLETKITDEIGKRSKHSSMVNSIRMRLFYLAFNNFYDLLDKHSKRFPIDSQGDKHKEYLEVIINNSYLTQFVNQWLFKEYETPSLQQSLGLLDEVLSKFDQLMKVYRNDSAAERVKLAEGWFTTLFEQENLAHLRHYLAKDVIHESSRAVNTARKNKMAAADSKVGTIDDLSDPKATAGAELKVTTLEINPITQFHEEGEVLSKLAAIYGRSPSIGVALTEPILDEVIFPTLHANRLSLPKFIHFFLTHDDNKAIYKLLTFAQAAAMRFGYVPLKEKNGSAKNDSANGNGKDIANVNGSTNGNNRFADYTNPAYAERLWTIITYNQALRCITEQHPVLAAELSGTVQNIAALSHPRIVGNTPSNQILSLLEQTLLLGKDADLVTEEAKENIKVIVTQNLLPTVAASSKESLEDMYILTRKLYEIINAEFNLQEYQQKEQGVMVSSAGEIMPMRQKFVGNYAGQPFFIFDEFQGTARSRVIVKQTSAVTNDRMAKAKIEHAAKLKTIKSLLEAITPSRVTIERHLYDGEIDETAYVEMMLEKKAGSLSDTDIYTQRRVHDRDIAVLLTINQSKTLGAWLDKEKRVLDYVRPVALYLLESASVTGDSVAVLGYTSRNSQEVFINVFKDFEEEHTTQVDYKLGLLSAIDNSRTGAAYRYCNAYLSEIAAKRRIHIDILSDLATDSDYTGEKAMQDTADAVRASRSRGIELFAISINPEITHSMLEPIYGAGHFQVVSDLKDLGEKVISIYKTIVFS